MGTMTHLMRRVLGLSIILEKTWLIKRSSCMNSEGCSASLDPKEVSLRNTAMGTPVSTLGIHGVDTCE